MSNSLPTVTHVYQNHHIDSTRWNMFKPRDNDIIISTSYKSGTTWMQGIVQHLVFLGQTKPPLGDQSPWLERGRSPVEEVLAELDAQTHRRFIKTHLALDGLPYFPQVKYIIVGRDARDVGMSMWNHYSHYTDAQYANVNDTPGRVGAPVPHAPDNVHTFWREWITRGWFPWESEGYPFWGNLRHTQTWWAYRHLDNFLFVHFADLLRDLKREIERIADFLDIRVTGLDLEYIARGVSLDAMRQEARETDAGLVRSFHGGAETFYFKGINGRWKDVLAADELELYERKVDELLTGEGRAWIENGRAG